MTYCIEFSPEADEHIASLTARDRATLLDAVGGQLFHEPTVEIVKAVGLKVRDRVSVGGREVKL